MVVNAYPYASVSFFFVSPGPDGVITITRKSLSKAQLPSWSTSEKTLLRKVYVSPKGFIEVDGKGLLQLDFANKVIGGGVLSSGLVQEEILFLKCPELIVTRLLAETMGDTEAVVIAGAEQYSVGKGYGDTFEWVGPFDGEHPRRCDAVLGLYNHMIIQPFYTLGVSLPLL
jgi:poly(ADP-ribose) glycohydrolase